jgi:hypothetical protein
VPHPVTQERNQANQRSQAQGAKQLDQRRHGVAEKLRQQHGAIAGARPRKQRQQNHEENEAPKASFILLGRRDPLLQMTALFGILVPD